MIKILLGSENKSKKEAIKIALEEVGINDYEIISVKVDSKVSSKPINEETLIGSKNRNRELFNYAKENKVDFDYLISIEGGYERILDDNCFIVTYASVIDKNGNEFIGKSQGLHISKTMFEYVKSGKSLNKIIEEILKINENKKANGISGYLTNDYYYRSKFDSTSIISAFAMMFNVEKYKSIERKLERL